MQPFVHLSGVTKTYRTSRTQHLAISDAVFPGTRVVVLTAGPARMADNFEIDLPRPRTLDMKTNARFGEYTRRIYRRPGME